MNTNGASPNAPNETDFHSSLRLQATEKSAEYSKLAHQSRRITVQLERVKSYIEHVNALLEAEGLPLVRLDSPSKATGFAKPGNRSKNMPVRKVQWEGYSLADISELILNDTDRALHANEMVEMVYEVTTPSEHKSAKLSLVSTLRTGAKNGRWVFEGKNIYSGIGERQQPLVPDTSLSPVSEE